MHYYRQLDGLRAVCILFTILNHIGPHPWFLNGSVGVDVFFTLSGYLITTLLIKDRESSGTVSLGCFYIRRFFRIVPLCYFTLLVGILAAFALHARGIQPGKLTEMTFAWPYVALFLSEYRPPEAGTFFGHAWTLGVEEKYYLLWPLIFLVLQKWRYEAQVIALALLLCLEAFLFPSMEFRGYGGLTIGSLLAVALQRRDSGLSSGILAVPPWISVAAAAAAYSATLFVEGDRVHVFVAAASGLLIVSAVNRRSLLSRALAWGPLVIAGRHTYGIYLIHVLAANTVLFALEKAHVPAQWMLSFLLTYLLSLACASAMKTGIEDPLIGVGRRLSVARRSRAPLLNQA